MKSITRFWISLPVFITMLFLSSCGEDWAFIEKTYTIAEENDAWLPAETDETVFLMKDNAGITHSYLQVQAVHELDKSWGGYFGITTDITYTEYRSRSYTSTYGSDYSISLRAATWEPYGDQLRVELNGIVFRYDLGLDLLTEISSPSFHIGSTQTSEGYANEETIYSACEKIDTVSLNGHTYTDVLHFQLKDHPETWDDRTVTEIFLEKGTGLIKYHLNGRIYFTLQEPDDIQTAGAG